MEWVVIVDDDKTNLELAERVLGESSIHATGLESGKSLLDFLKLTDVLPDLILLDIDMPDPDGFETLSQLRRQRGAMGELPVIFLSSDKNQEREVRGLQLGAMDCIRKPFVPEILVSRVKNALRTQEKLLQLEKEAMTDSMTGFLNKNTAEDRIREICRTESGLLCVLDLDSFKLVNDLFGHDMGDRVLILFSDLLKNNMRAEDVCGRIGGDEFLVFARNMRTESELIHFTERINDDYCAMLRELLGDRLKFTVGISIGAASVPVHGREYSQLFHLADQALNTAKQRGKHCCVLMGSRGAGQVGPVGTLTLDSVTMILEERNVSSNAMWMGRDAFINIYRYMNRYLERYHGVAYRALLTINILSETADKQTRADIVAQFRTIMQQSLRNSDVMVEVSENQIFLLLPQMHEASIDVVMNRLMSKWEQLPCHDQAIITWETGKVHLTEREAPRQDVRQERCRVLVISEDRIVRELAESVLGEQGDRVTALRTGAGAPELVKADRPDVILLDETLPDTDGLSVLRALKADEGCRSVPVLLVTADETHGAEAVRMQPGAEDVLQKPLVPELLALRVRNTAERIRLKEKLS